MDNHRVALILKKLQVISLARDTINNLDPICEDIDVAASEIMAAGFAALMLATVSNGAPTPTVKQVEEARRLAKDKLDQWLDTIAAERIEGAA